MEKTLEYYKKTNAIMETYLQSSSLDNTVREAAEILEAELVVADRLLYPVAYTERSLPDASWEDLAMRKRVPSLGWIAHLDREAVLMTRGRSRMYEWTQQGERGRCLLVDIERNQRKLAFLSVTTQQEELTEEYMEMILIFAGVIAIQFENKAGHLTENSVFEHYMTALIENTFNSDDADELLADTGLSPNGVYSLCLVDIARYDHERYSLHSFRIAMERAAHVTRSTVHNNHLVLLLTASSEETARTRDYSLLEAALEEYGTYAAVSRTFTSLWRVSSYYAGAGKILSHSFCAPIGTRVLSSENMGISFVVDALLRTEKPDELVDPRVRKLLAYDEKNGTEYVKTLFTVLRYSRRVSLTCEKMHIHRNTLDYRLQRIVEITGIDWSDGDLCFRIYLSLNALMFIERRKSYME